VSEPVQTSTNPFTDPLRPPTVVISYFPGELQEKVKAAVADQTGDQYETMPLDKRDPTGFGRTLAALWPQGRNLIIVAQDVVPPPSSLAELDACPEQWCTYYYPTEASSATFGLGLVKFSALLMGACPDLARDASVHPESVEDYTVPWWELDSAYERELIRLGIARHSHGTAVRLHAAGS
jgi:hypothetical protein